MDTQGIFSALRQTYGGISSQMKRLEVISENIANAEALPDKGGKLYQRKVTVVKDPRNGSSDNFSHTMSLKMQRSSDKHLGMGSNPSSSMEPGQSGTSRVEIVELAGEKIIHDPTHPRADEEGYVKMPNVNVIEEMVDLMATNRAYEANITVMNASKVMAKKTFEI